MYEPEETPCASEAVFSFDREPSFSDRSEMASMRSCETMAMISYPVQEEQLKGFREYPGIIISNIFKVILMLVYIYICPRQNGDN